MKIKCKDFVSEIELNDSETAKAIKDTLPITGNAQCWQEEVYFEIPVARELENGVERVEQGDVTYWPNGKCFCVFYGQSQPISAVTVIGKVKTNLDKFKEVVDGEEIILDNN